MVIASHVGPIGNGNLKLPLKSPLIYFHSHSLSWSRFPSHIVCCSFMGNSIVIAIAALFAGIHLPPLT